MSLAAMVYAIHQSPARGMTKWVQVLLADYVDADTGQAGPPGPSMETIARDGGIGKATVLRAIEKLTTQGELLVERGGPGAGNANVYVFPRFRDQQAQRTGADRPRKRASNGPERSVGGVGKRTANGPPTDRSVGRYMDDPYPDPSSGTGSPSPTLSRPSKATSQSAKGREGRPPRRPRHRSDPFVVDRAREIRQTQGDGAALAYLRTVDANYGQSSRADQLARLDALIAEHGPNLEGRS